MRRNLLALVALVAVVGTLYLWIMANRSFQWQAQYRDNGDEPYDCMIFDSLAAATMPRGYTCWKQSLDSLMHLPGRKSILIINQTWGWDSVAWVRLDSCVRKGDKVLLALHYNIDMLQEKYSVTRGWDRTDESVLAEALKGKLPPDTVEWAGRRPCTVHIPQGVLSSWFSHDYDRRFTPTAFMRSDSLWRELADGKDDDTRDLQHVRQRTGTLRMPIALQAQIGKGWLYVSSTPHLFTNYGALDPNISKYLNRQLAELADYPTYKVGSKLFAESWDYQQQNDFSQSPLSYMLSRPPLRWALYTLLAAVALFMLFTARRRQRVIPVHEPPANRNLEFVRLLGTIYHRRHDNIDLLRKKYTYFKDEVRQRMMMDLDDERQLQANARVLAQRTGLAEDEVARLLNRLRGIVALSAGDISSADLKDYIDQIENISKHL